MNQGFAILFAKYMKIKAGSQALYKEVPIHRMETTPPIRVIES
jgi:hypothetical protein